MSDYRKLSNHLGYVFQDTALLERALRHRSAGKDNNERLEFLGDAVLSLVIAEALSQHFPSAPEGELSRMRASLVKGATLAKVAREFELGDYVLLGGGELKSGGHRRDSILADVVEALIGAIYTEAGFATARDCVQRWFKARMESLSSGEALKDAKTRLQEFLQARAEALPDYSLVEQSGLAHEQQFEVSCRTALHPEPVQARAGSRKKAEQAAAQAMLDILQSKS
ncbi:ribonuclease-3 [Litorivivens lipolytica]|uniref:Ribonuclease 3 n=1 Tax=Litorivivens lipolytica TaxID=1524264 RepID=A0A7W4W325_9GAMM|nr:ribonuclease III [Litorivivens lipolytica]MBB3046002.1 ribonuclease-3 [Litorivivens lipolytica]